MERNIDQESMKRIDVPSIVRDVLQYRYVIVLLALAAALFAEVWVTKVRRPQYTSEAVVAVTSKEINDEWNSEPDLTATIELSEVFSRVLESDVLKRKVATELGMEEFTAKTAVKMISETNMLEFSVTADTAIESYRIMSSVLDNYAEVSDYVFDDAILEVIRQPMIPTKASNIPGRARTMVLACGMTFILLVLAIAAFSYMRDTVKGEQDFAMLDNIRLFGRVTHEKKQKKDKKNRRKNYSLLIQNPLVSPRFVEENKMIAARVINAMDPQDKKVLLVTSLMENEGKSTVAANLALSLAQTNKKVLLIDLDFRRPALYKIFREPKKNVVNLPEILKNSTWEGRVISKREDSGLYTMFNGTSCSSMEELLESHLLKRFIDFFRKKMDYIIIDTAPIALVSDTEQLTQLADASLLVVRQDMACVKDVTEVINVLDNTNAKVLGAVFNNVAENLFHKTVGYGEDYGKETK